MAFPAQMAAKIGTYMVKNWAMNKKRFSTVLMLEPTERCNLSCAGCGRIREYGDILDKILTVEDCLEAVDEVGAPTVTITGGEPLIHPQIKEIVEGIVKRRKYIHFCTNGLLLEQSLDKFPPNDYLAFVLHMDGLEDEHDAITGRKGVFRTALNAIRTAKERGFRVYTNTTIFKNVNFDDIRQLFDILTEAGIDGLMISPAFHYDTVGSNIFLSRDEIAKTFQSLESLRGEFDFYNTSAYLDFLLGKKDVACMPWSTPTLTPSGWRRPCYLLADEHCKSYRELMNETDWSKYGVGNDPRCANCMVHCGFEASLIDRARRSLPELFSLAKG